MFGVIHEDDEAQCADEMGFLKKGTKEECINYIRRNWKRFDEKLCLIDCKTSRFVSFML